jgi:hypothetical protein
MQCCFSGLSPTLHSRPPFGESLLTYAQICVILLKARARAGRSAAALSHERPGIEGSYWG